MMIYKNVYPGDFENLHNGKGALYSICRRRLDLVAEIKRKLNSEIAAIKAELSHSDNEHMAGVNELIKMFIGHVVSVTGGQRNYYGIYLNNNDIISFADLKTWDSFTRLFQINNIRLASSQYQASQLGKSFSQLEAEIHPNQTFAQRKKAIDNKAAAVQLALHKKIQTLERQKTLISQMALNELLQKNDVSVEEIISDNKLDDKGLLVYLVKDGYLDENYHLYISNFHEGRLSKNDHDFLIAIRDYRHPDPKQPLNNLDEVIADMRPEDFGQKYVLNIALVDFLLTQQGKYKSQIDSAIKYISSHFEDTEDFFAAYWDVGLQTDDLVKALAHEWPQYGATAIKSTQAPNHIARILRNVDSKYVAEKMNSQDVISNYVSEHGNLVFTSDISAPTDYEVLRELNVKFQQLASILKNKALLTFAHKECLYEINAANIGILLDTYPRDLGDLAVSRPDHVIANYTAICSYGSAELKKYIDDNLAHYIDAVLLAMPDNISESPEIVKQLIRVTTLDHEKKQQIISKQKMFFETFDGIPIDLWEYILSNEKVCISWPNITSYLKEDDCNREILTETLNKSQIVNVLATQCDAIDKLSKNDRKLLADFIIANDAIGDAEYEKLAKCLPFRYAEFPDEISQIKRKFLAQTGMVHLTPQSYASAAEDEELIFVLISKNIEEFLVNKEEYAISDEIRERLLSHEELTSAHKIQICQDVTLSSMQTSKNLFLVVGRLIKLPEANCSSFNSDVVSYVIVNTQNTEDAIRYFMKCIPHWDKNMIMSVLGQLPAPFNEIQESGKSPRVPKTPLNLEFARLLEAHKIISSITEKDNAIRINTFRMSD